MQRLLKIVLIGIFITIGMAEPVLAKMGRIEGVVKDAETGELLPGVNVMVEHTTIGAATDGKGVFFMPRVPQGKVHVTASMIGYKTAHEVVHVRPNWPVTINFSLQPTLLEMGSVVVTGTATPHLVEDMPVRTEVIPRRMIEQKQASNLAEALAFHTGIRVENNCSNCNFSQVRILGMDGKYSQILIDGDPVVSSLAGVYGLEHFPEEMVDQIEVVKGGGSSLYGGGAVAGVINMITRRPLMNQVRIKYLNNVAGGETDQRLGAVAETVNKAGTSGAYVFGSFRQRNPYDHNDDGYSELGELKNESIGFKWYYQPKKNGEFMTSFHRIHEERRGGNDFDVPVHAADIAEWVEHWRMGGTVRWTHRPTPLFDYRIYYSYSDEDRKSYFGGLADDSDAAQLEALTYYGKTESLLHLAGLQGNYRVGTHLITAGLQFSDDELQDETAAETAYHLDEAYINTGIFVQDNLHFGTRDQVELVAGARVDKHSELDNWVFSPRINAKFKLGHDFTARAAVTTGFKPPQTYDEDLHLGGLEGSQRIIRNSADLGAEHSFSYSSGLEYRGYLKKMPAMFSLTGFVTRLNDGFTERFVGQQGATELWERVNSDGARVQGVELDFGIRPRSSVEVRGGFTFKKGEYDSPNADFGTKKFLRTPDLTSNLSLNWTPHDKLRMNLSGSYIGSADVPHEVVVIGQDDPELRLEESDSFIQLDFGLTYTLPINHGMDTRLNLGIRNITNSYQQDLDWGADRDPAYVYGPSRPRTIYFGLETLF